MSLHRDVFTNLVERQGWTRGAELGVDKGILFGMLLHRCPMLELIGVDTFPDPQRSHRAFSLEREFGDRARLLRMNTDAAASKIPDQMLDFVFIDADHSEAAVTSDIALWRSKVKPGGWLGGHDYSRKFPGVIAAVNAVFPKPKLWPGDIWGIWC